MPMQMGCHVAERCEINLIGLHNLPQRFFSGEYDGHETGAVFMA